MKVSWFEARSISNIFNGFMLVFTFPQWLHRKRNNYPNYYKIKYFVNQQNIKLAYWIICGINIKRKQNKQVSELEIWVGVCRVNSAV